MGSVDNNQNPWAPYDNYKDCSSEICSIYCPQYCYLIFPPPPLSDDDSSTPFSPLIIAIIGVLASAFILVCYYTIGTRYCRRRNVHDSSSVNDEYHSEISRDQQQQQTLSVGLDEELIKSITVYNYRKDEGLIEGSECAVCLGEFQDNESLRLLPKCDHAFHLPCIDTWLKSHSNCPLCRANVVVLAHPTPISHSSPDLNMNSYEIHRPNDLILVVDDLEIVSENIGNDQKGVEEFGRSMSFGAFSCQRELMVSDILRIEETDEDLLVANGRACRGVGSSMGLLRSPVATERSVSSSRFMFMVHDKGNNSMHLS